MVIVSTFTLTSQTMWDLSFENMRVRYHDS